ncbi:MAG: substrate-binding domain-containing protein [Oscillospiraceae bacterium]|nr:substrate-binding domain-containing protein [Oscillospiraceae bacterium]
MDTLKKTLAVLIAALIICSALAACGNNNAGSATQPQPGPAEGGSQQAAPSETSEVPAAAKPGFFLTAEYSRLYFAPADGSDPQLIIDNSVIGTVRRGDLLYVSFEDGSIRRVSADGKVNEELAPASPRSYRRLIPFNGGVIGLYYSFTEGSGYDLFRSGSLIPEALFDEDRSVVPGAMGKYLYCHRLGYEDESRLEAYDIESLELIWETQIDSSVEILDGDGSIYCFIPNSGRLFIIDEEARSLSPVDIPLKDTDCELHPCGSQTFIAQGNWSDDNRSYLINGANRQLLETDIPYYYSISDIYNGKALLYYITGLESAAGDHYSYSKDNFVLLDLASGSFSEFPVRGQYSRLFANGDFPVIDSSTARKPVTSEIYAFFCESTGAGGALPLCSTTHGAWLNIADRKADLALLAAPTQEEQDYLAERGVSVDMKLYGGDGLVFIGNRACGVENMSLDQLRAIYRGEITNWAQLGGTDHPIRVLYRDDQSGSQRLFERMLWKDEPVPDFNALGFEILGDMSTIVSECIHDPYAIGYSIMTYLNDVFSKEELLVFSLNGYSATPENIASKSYPLGTQGYVVIRSDEPEGSPARRLFNWFGSPLSDVILTLNSVTPLHAD